MIVNSNFIRELVNSFHNNLLCHNDWCEAANFEPTNDFYKKKIYQKIYALRYLPAYYFEYCVLANELYNRIKNDYIFINVASFGCGLAPDYYALKDNLRNINFTYIGYDAVEWSTKHLMPTPQNNFSFALKHVNNISQNTLDNIDVYIFPKSIGDIENSTKGTIKRLATSIASTPKERLFFLNSYVNNTINISQDLTIFKEIHNTLTSAGFATKDNVDRTHYMGSQYHIGLRAINNDFIYPNNKFIACEDEGSKTECRNCSVIKRPILNNDYMDYHLIEYYKL
ncbi:hypothetical protein A1507_19695 [Methylomonas koyamae]|uniref:Uncharacterized protein n=1 Tax=Methylomonas koyamae TaxID=702114 RepID=A0A177N283_9GAMM|nr:hypothetical protein [Methylomonas koyamae]OAI11754.1 hypothetical protein A1507_19695 [Methylomonas koyamae]